MLCNKPPPSSSSDQGKLNFLLSGSDLSCGSVPGFGASSDLFLMPYSEAQLKGVPGLYSYVDV